MDNSMDNSKIKLYVATPCYGGMVTDLYLLGLLDLQRECLKRDILLKVFTLGNESLVPRARNICVSMFLDDSAHFTHLLFIDADIGFRAENVFRLLNCEQEVCCGIYPKKDINWEEVGRLAQEEGEDHKSLQARSLMYNLSFPDDSEIVVKDGFVEVVDGATGFMLLQREVLEKMKSAYPELRYVSDHWLNSQKYESENTFLFFDCMKDPQSGRYLSEDYTFCRRWRAIGGKVYADIAMPLTHLGSYAFKGHVGTKFKLKSLPSGSFSANQAQK